MSAYRRINNSTQTSNRSQNYRSFNQNNNTNVENFNRQSQPQSNTSMSKKDAQNLESLKNKVTEQQRQRDEQMKNIQKEHNQHLENRPIQQPLNPQPQTQTQPLNPQQQSHGRQNNVNMLRQTIQSELQNEFSSKLEEDKKKLRLSFEEEFQRKLENEKNKLSQQYNNSLKREMENNKKKQISTNQNLTLNDITEMYKPEEKVDGYHILEVNRILQNEPSLTFDQARTLANSNGCLESGSNTMCPSKKIEHYSEKGNCVGGDCRVHFSEHQDTQSNTNNKPSVVDQIKNLNIEFYSNDRCGFCHRSRDLFSKEGVLEHMTVKNNEPLPKDIRGYPHFHSNKTGKHHTGAPSSVQALIQRLS